MDYSLHIAEALQEKLDVGVVYPIVYTMTPQTIELFVTSVFTKLHGKIDAIMKDSGGKFVADDDFFGLTLMLLRNGVRLPNDMLMEISKHIIKRARETARWIAPVQGQEGDLWYCKMYLNLNNTKA